LAKVVLGSLPGNGEGGVGGQKGGSIAAIVSFISQGLSIAQWGTSEVFRDEDIYTEI